MTWLYKQSNGELTHDGVYIGTGYSGTSIGRNNPVAQAIANIGPIPEGEYTIGPAFMHPTKGPLVMRLFPESANEMYGRYGFLIHGDSIKAPGTASNGCIILSHDIRQKITGSDDNNLTVIA